jgi:hypothetical protein
MNEQQVKVANAQLIFRGYVKLAETGDLAMGTLGATAGAVPSGIGVHNMISQIDAGHERTIREAANAHRANYAGLKERHGAGLMNISQTHPTWNPFKRISDTKAMQKEFLDAVKASRATRNAATKGPAAALAASRGGGKGILTALAMLVGGTAGGATGVGLNRGAHKFQRQYGGSGE